MNSIISIYYELGFIMNSISYSNIIVLITYVITRILIVSEKKYNCSIRTSP